MKILKQFPMKNKDKDLRKLSILRSYCNDNTCTHGCLASHEKFNCCTLIWRDTWLDTRIESNLPFEWKTPEREPEYEEEDLDEAIKWWQEMIQTDKYKEYSEYIH